MIYWHISVLCYFRIYLFVLFKLSLSFIWLQGLQVSQNISWSSQDDQRAGEILCKQEFNDCLAWVNTQNSTAWTSHDNFSSPNCVLPLISQTKNTPGGHLWPISKSWPTRLTWLIWSQGLQVVRQLQRQYASSVVGRGDSSLQPSGTVSYSFMTDAHELSLVLWSNLILGSTFCNIKCSIY